MKLNTTYMQMIWAMMKTGIIGFGGGPSVIPLIKHEVVKVYGWMEEEEFDDLFVIANTLPGPIATKISGYVGYQLKGSMGAVIAVIAHILPSSLAMLVLMSTVSAFSESSVVQSMIGAVVPVVSVMLGLMAYEFAEKAVKGLGIYIGIALFGLSLLLLEIVHIHPAIVIIVFMVYGSMHFKIVEKWKRKHHRKEVD